MEKDCCALFHRLAATAYFLIITGLVSVVSCRARSQSVAVDAAPDLIAFKNDSFVGYVITETPISNQ